MAKIREIQTIKIPILLTKDDQDGKDVFLLTCRPLSIYIQSSTEEQAKKELKEAIDALFKHLINSKKLIRFLRHRNLIESDKTRIAISKEKLIDLSILLLSIIKTQWINTNESYNNTSIYCTTYNRVGFGICFRF